MPFAWLSIDTTRSRRSLKILLCSAMKPCGPFSASTAAHCETAVGFDVDCDCTVAIADAPTGHAVGLRTAVDRERARIKRGLHLRRRREFEIVVDEMLIHIVGHHVHV